MRWSPKDAVAVVTGASSGIGHCLTRQLAEQGTTVVAVARRREPLEDFLDQPAIRSAGGQVIPVIGDVTDSAVREAIVRTAGGVRSGELDLLVNNAGIGAIGAFETASPERLRRVMEVNFFAPAELTRAALPLLKKGRAPVICNVSSVLGHCAVPGKSEYCGSKFALHGWSDSIRAELSEYGIQVTLVSPSTTRSEFFDSLIETGASEKSSSIGSWTPEKVSRKALAAIKSRRREVILSLGGKALVLADRIAPSLMAWALSKGQARRGDDQPGP